MTPDGFPEDDDDTPPRTAPDRPHVQHVYHERAKGDGRSNARMFLWLIWIVCTGFYLLLNWSGPSFPADVTRVLIYFFLFYALDRIIG